MITVSGVCKCKDCEARTSSIYRMIGACMNCGLDRILMLFRAGDKVCLLDCPKCGVREVKSQRAATDREIPEAP